MTDVITKIPTDKSEDTNTNVGLTLGNMSIKWGAASVLPKTYRKIIVE